MRRSRFMLAVFLILVIAGVARYKPAYYATQLDPGPDATEYAITSVSLYQHGAYSMMINHTPYPPQYPHGFPLLLMPAYATFGPQAQNGVYATLVYWLAVVVLTIVLGRRVFGAPAALVAGLAVAIGPAFFDTGKKILSDAASVLLLLLIGLFVMKAWEGKRQLLWIAAAGLLAGLVTVVRVGEAPVLVMMPLAIVVMLRRSPRRALGALVIFGCAALAPIVPQLLYDWQAYGSPFTTGYVYWNLSLTGTTDSFISLKYLFEPTSLDPTANVPYYLTNLLGIDIAGYGALYWPTFVLAIVAGVVAVCRNAALRRRDLLVVALLVAGNLPIYLICGFHNVRYILLTAIVVVMLAGRGVGELWHMAAARAAGRTVTHGVRTCPCSRGLWHAGYGIQSGAR